MAWAGVLLCVALQCMASLGYDNRTISTDRSYLQLMEFELKHPKPIGLLTLGSGAPVDVRDTNTINSDLFRQDIFFEVQSHIGGALVPPRVVQPKGFGAWGYFEVTNDVSKYTKADVFNGVGKKTPALVRFGVGYPGTGGTDLFRDLKDMAVKLYTKEGLLDLLSIQIPFFSIKDPSRFTDVTHALARRNPKSNLIDFNMIWDFSTLHPFALAATLYIFSDLGRAKGWRHSDFFPVHTFELINKDGERWYARFNWRTEQGVDFITDEEVVRINDIDYFNRDMYNAIENKTYPSWRLEMDLLSLDDIQKVDFNPFDVTRTWKKGKYHTDTIGRLVLNRVPENQFRDSEQVAFNPANLVPGIPGPVDQLFRGRRFAYRDTQNHRIGRNHFKVGVNSPYYAKSYVRDGHPPVGDNGKDSPIYYPNSFNGPVPFVNDKRPKEFLQVLESGAVDLQEAADVYNNQDEAAKHRMARNIARVLTQTVEKIQKRLLKMLYLTSPDLAHRIEIELEEFLAQGYNYYYL